MDSSSFLHKCPSKIPKDAVYCHKPNIVKSAAKVLDKLRSNEEVVVVAEMQVGKSELMKRVIYVINKYNDKLKDYGVCIDKYNVYVVICASSGIKRTSQSKIT